MAFHPTEASSESAMFLHEHVADIEPVIRIDEACVVVTEVKLQVRLPKSGYSRK